jgi:fatty aldehyde-generating acyl-ACP reductase
MPDTDLITISVSRVIPAKKWRIIYLITKVADFPDYMPNVKEATVLHKSRNKIKTRWKILVDNIPITWVEEDTLALSQNTIFFNAVEGDLSVFKGEWKFDEHQDGTSVTVNVGLRVAIPGIKDFAEHYLKKLLTGNFEMMLEAIEKRLISKRYMRHKMGEADKVAGFGIIGHPYNLSHLESCFKMLNPNFVMPSPEFVTKLFHVTPSFKLYDIKDFKSDTGQLINGCFIIATFIPEMIEKDIWTVFSKVVRACKIAERHGIGIVTLGGFTSIVAERIGQEIAHEVDIAVTSGNTFTAAMAVDGVKKAASLLELDIAPLKVTIVGGTGDIGSGCARELAGKVKQLTITGRTKQNLAKLSSELKKLRKARIEASMDNKEAVKDADIVIAVASATSPILQPEWFKPGAIICDVGYPKNISYAPVTREDILVFSGGLSRSPTPVNFPIDLALPANTVLYGCFAEGIILALEKRFENFSFGRGNITSEKIEEIRSLGKKHGFEVADFYWGHTLVEQAIIDRIKEAIHNKKR